MFVRFTTFCTDPDSHHPQGVFQAAFELRDTVALADHEARELAEALGWLQMHLKSPECLREPENHRALSWFKPTAREPMRQVWRIAQLLEEHGRRVQVHKRRDPGIVIYEDGWQAVAKPRRKRRH